MALQWDQVPPLHTMFFALADLEKRSEEASWAGSSSLEAKHKLFAVYEGHGTLTLDGRAYRMMPGSYFVASPGSWSEIRGGGKLDLCWYEVVFDVYRAHDGKVVQDDTLLRSANARLTEYKPQLLGMLQELYADKEAVREIDRFRNHIRFQELFYTLFQQELLEQPVKTDTRAAVERSIELLHRAYQEELTVERLAKEANIGRWQYTNLFKQLTGKSPIDYLTDIRIQRAKELLLTSDCKLREIAVLVGYRDEYYFNRRFRQTVGVSPKRYIQSMRQSLKVATLQYAGEMLALGMKPVAATDAMIGNYADALSGVTTIGDYNFNPNRLAEVKPDLVLAPDYWSHQELEKMTKLAPVAVVPWEDDVFERLRAIARLLGKQREAKSWLARYAAKAKQAKQRTAGAIRKGETALILAVSGTEISFLGARNVGQTIYHVIGFHPPKPIEHLIRQDSCFSGGELAIEELSRLETDRIFVVVNDNEHASTTLAQLLASEQWRSHKAVGKGMVYMLDKRWMWYDPHTLEWQIGEAVRMLAR